MMMNRGTIEMAKTVMEMAEVAFTALECCHMQHQLYQGDHSLHSPSETKALQYENRRLKNLLKQNLELLCDLSESPTVVPDCPTDVCAY